MHRLPPSWGWGRAGGSWERSEHHLCFLLRRALPVPAPGRGTGSVPVPSPSASSPHPWLVSKGCQELRSLKRAASTSSPPGSWVSWHALKTAYKRPF